MRRNLTIAYLLMAFGSAQMEFAFAASEPEAEEPAESEEAVEQDAEASPKFEFVMPPDGPNQPWRLLRGLQRLQDELVLGKARSEDAYKILLLELAKIMGDLDDSVWEYERNLNALGTYIILGGNAELGYKALQKTSLRKPKTLPLMAAVAYSERDMIQAQRLMEAIDLDALPVSMSAHFALAKSMVASSTDLKRAMMYLDDARRIAPWTLVEEAALRRAIRITGETRDFEKFSFLARSYMRRFNKSYYMLDFLRNVSFSIVRMSDRYENELLFLLDDVFRNLDSSHQVSVAAYVARSSTISGKKRLSDWASSRALERLNSGTTIHARMQLYSAAVNITDPDKTETAMEQLEAIAETPLDDLDKQIYDSAKLLGEQILQESMKIQDEETEELTAEIKQNATLARGEAILSELDEILNGKVQ